MGIIKEIIAIEKKPRQGLLPLDWTVVIYTLVTLAFIMVLWTRLHNPWQMIGVRVQALVMLFALWGVYRMVPCRLTHLARLACQMGLLGIWYPDTSEFNRIFHNLDYFFAEAEQSLFGFQPALTFSENWPHPVISELLSLGYVSYYPLIALVVVFYFIWRYTELDRAAFTIMASFFLFYVVFIFLPVAGPQFYYLAVGLDQIQAGNFPDIGYYFENHQESLPVPGWEDGFFHQMVIDAHDAGERPTAAFPSSHVGVTVVLLWLAWRARNARLFWIMMPFAVLMFFGTFYIQAHYAIDAIFGIVAGTIIYFLCQFLYNLLPSS